LTDEVNKAGCYVIKLCVNGAWQEVMIDDYLPVSYGCHEPFFGKAEKND
jgi:hypothetical protein